MTIKGIRWGLDFECGPESGSEVVEVRGTGDTGDVYALVTHYEDAETVLTSREPLFDKWCAMMSGDIDGLEEQNAALERGCMSVIKNELGTFNFALLAGEDASLIRFARYVMGVYLGADSAEESAMLDGLKAVWTGVDIDATEVPEAEYPSAYED